METIALHRTHFVLFTVVSLDIGIALSVSLVNKGNNKLFFIWSVSNAEKTLVDLCQIVTVAFVFNLNENKLWLDEKNVTFDDQQGFKNKSSVDCNTQGCVLAGKVHCIIRVSKSLWLYVLIN